MNHLKRQVLPSGLWVVATPIGNLSDLSDRARQALEEAQGILCEDTRRTAQLFSALGIARPEEGFERLDAHASEGKIGKVIEELASGKTFALVTDAGTPGVSDPGARLVEAARSAGVAVTPIPGPSAVMTLLSVSGFDETSFVFRGFFPRKDSQREKEWEAIQGSSLSGLARLFVWFESPERIVSALQWLAEKEPHARMLAAKELTKIHEQFFTGESFLVAGEVKHEVEQAGVRGEWCFALLMPRKREELGELGTQGAEWMKTLSCLSEAGVRASDSVKLVSRSFGIPKNRVYEAALKIFSKKTSEGD